MITAKLSNGALVIGIEARNVEHLKAGHPFHLHGSQVGGFDGVTELLIVYGDTLKQVYDQLNEASGGQLPPFVQPKRRDDA